MLQGDRERERARNCGHIVQQNFQRCDSSRWDTMWKNCDTSIAECSPFSCPVGRKLSRFLITSFHFSWREKRRDDVSKKRRGAARIQSHAKSTKSPCARTRDGTAPVRTRIICMCPGGAFFIGSRLITLQAISRYADFVSVYRRAKAGEGGPAQPLRSPVRGPWFRARATGQRIWSGQGRGRRAVRYDAARTVGRHDRLQLPAHPPVTIYTTPPPSHFSPKSSRQHLSSLRSSDTHTQISLLATTFD
jgi:hypothetical protein